MLHPEEFANDPVAASLICQIDGVGVGLNLHCASAVVLMEPQLKPTSEWQAIKRAHRMGQARRVVVHRLLSRDTIEERWVTLLERKTTDFDEYARESAIKDASSQANETGIADLEKTLVAGELSRVGSP